MRTDLDFPPPRTLMRDPPISLFGGGGAVTVNSGNSERKGGEDGKH